MGRKEEARPETLHDRSPCRVWRHCTSIVTRKQPFFIPITGMFLPSCGLELVRAGKLSKTTPHELPVSNSWWWSRVCKKKYVETCCDEARAMVLTGYFLFGSRWMSASLPKQKDNVCNTQNQNFQRKQSTLRVVVGATVTIEGKPILQCVSKIVAERAEGDVLETN